jgi:hypothetical protein
MSNRLDQALQAVLLTRSLEEQMRALATALGVAEEAVRKARQDLTDLRRFYTGVQGNRIVGGRFVMGHDTVGQMGQAERFLFSLPHPLTRASTVLDRMRQILVLHRTPSASTTQRPRAAPAEVIEAARRLQRALKTYEGTHLRDADLLALRASALLSLWDGFSEEVRSTLGGFLDSERRSLRARLHSLWTGKQCHESLANHALHALDAGLERFRKKVAAAATSNPS